MRALRNLAAIAHDPDVGNGVLFSKVPVPVSLSQSPESHQLKELFEPFGIVSGVKLTMDCETGGARCFGFVTMAMSRKVTRQSRVSIKDKGARKLRNKSHFLVPEAFRILSHL